MPGQPFLICDSLSSTLPCFIPSDALLVCKLVSNMFTREYIQWRWKLKKIRKSGSARKSRSSSGSSFFSGKSSARKSRSPVKGTSFFARKRTKSASKRKSGKTYRAEERKENFVKPAHDPGPKIRPQGLDAVEEYSVEEGEGSVQQALQSTGSGCCGSITGFFWLLAIGGFAVIIIFIFKCGGC